MIETKPGRIEAVVLAPGAAVLPRGGDVPGQGVEGLHRDPAELSAEIDAAVKRANATLAANQRVVAWRLWPDADFPRTHTLKVKRDRIRAWAVVEQPLPIGGRRGRAAPGDRGSRRDRRGRFGPRRALADDRDLETERLERGRDRRGLGLGRVGRRPGVEHERRADLADDVLGVVRELDPAGSGGEVAAISVPAA